VHLHLIQCIWLDLRWLPTLSIDWRESKIVKSKPLALAFQSSLRLCQTGASFALLAAKTELPSRWLLLAGLRV
jgi:hypothetical protein